MQASSRPIVAAREGETKSGFSGIRDDMASTLASNEAGRNNKPDSNRFSLRADKPATGLISPEIYSRINYRNQSSRCGKVIRKVAPALACDSMEIVPLSFCVIRL